MTNINFFIFSILTFLNWSLFQNYCIEIMLKIKKKTFLLKFKFKWGELLDLWSGKGRVQG